MISILLATYNGHEFIEKSINSILNQTNNKFELLIGLNGGKNDITKSILSKYDDDRVIVFDYGDLKGKSKTLNKLLAEAKYEWVAIQDDDDIWLPNKLESQLNYIDEYDVIGTFISYIDKEGKHLDNLFLSQKHSDILTKSFKGHNQMANSSVILKKIDILDIGGWDESLDSLADEGYQPLEDYDLWIKLLKNGKKFINHPEMLVQHRIHLNSKFNNKKLNLNRILC
jgi:glycosyltransferase involved in cell wall biosynthesis